MNSNRIIQTLVIGVFALIVIAASAQARPVRGGGTITPPPVTPPIPLSPF